MNCDPEGVGLGETCSIQPQGWGSRPRHTEVLSFYQESRSLFLGVCQRILEDLKAEHETVFLWVVIRIENVLTHKMTVTDKDG